MITGVGSVAILVRDGRKSAQWYHDKLGFGIARIEGHAVFFQPSESQAALLHLCERCDDWGNDQPGGRTGIWLRCGKLTLRKDESTGKIIPASNPANLEKTYYDSKNGVQFTQKLTNTSWSKMAILRDPDGNEFEPS
jgi:catechol 2,3-dioxygenase-like lactoylglutathione lyase family enzyme